MTAIRPLRYPNSTQWQNLLNNPQCLSPLSLLALLRWRAMQSHYLLHFDQIPSVFWVECYFTLVQQLGLQTSSQLGLEHRLHFSSPNTLGTIWLLRIDLFRRAIWEIQVRASLLGKLLLRFGRRHSTPSIWCSGWCTWSKWLPKSSSCSRRWWLKCL